MSDNKEITSAMNDVSYGRTQPEPLTVLDPKYVPEVGKRDDLVDRPNFAEDKELTDKVLTWVRTYKQTFEDLAGRENEIKNIDLADEMYRKAAVANQIESKESTNVDPTKSNVTSTSFYNGIRTITSGELAVILGNTEDLPVVFEPVPGSTDYRQEEARTLSDAQNAILEYCWDKDNMRNKVADILFYGAKYGNILMVMDWERIVEERKDIVPKKTKLDNLKERFFGKPVKPSKFGVETKKRNVKNNPTLKWYDIGKCWFDCTIDSIQDQSCVGWRDQYQLTDIYNQQASGEWMNAEKITVNHLYNDDQGGLNETIRDRKANIGIADDTSSVNTLFDVYTFWVRLPIDIKTGKWNPDRNTQTWFKTVWCGDINGTPICLQLEPNMHWSKKIPAKLFHTHRDDAGALHISYAVLMKDIYAMECTLLNQSLDNTRLLSRKPWIIERGSIDHKKLTFSAGGNEVWFKTPGASNPTELKIDSTNGIIVPMLDRVQEYAQDCMGTNKILNGENLGSRTSAQEASSVFEQALKPALEDAKYKANQILPFIARWVSDMTKQFSDSDETYFITKGKDIIEVKPSEMYGDFSIRITAVKKFQDSILRTRQESIFLQQIYPLMQDMMSKTGKIKFFTNVAKNRGFENVEEWFDLQPEIDAQNWASSENQNMVQGIPLMPKEGENHIVHLKIHRQLEDSLTYLPPGQIDPNVINIIRQHIGATEQLLAVKSSGAGVQNIQQPQQPQEGMQQQAQPGTEGEAGGDMLNQNGMSQM